MRTFLWRENSDTIVVVAAEDEDEACFVLDELGAPTPADLTEIKPGPFWLAFHIDHSKAETCYPDISCLPLAALSDQVEDAIEENAFPNRPPPPEDE